MARGLMVGLAFAATVAQAQEATKAAEETHRAVLPESEQAAVMLASRLAPQPAAGPLSLKGGSRDGGAGAEAVAEGTSDKLADCSGFETFLHDGDLAVRHYPPPPASTDAPREKPPYVGAAMRCGRRIVLQVKSRSKRPWAIKHATLEGPNGEDIQVHRLGFKAAASAGINVIVAEAPPGVEVASLKLNLTGADGRVARLEARDLP